MNTRKNYRKNRKQNCRHKKQRKNLRIHGQMPKGKVAKYYNRRHYDGWSTPSGNQCIQMHRNAFDFICKFLPVKNLTLEFVYFFEMDHIIEASEIDSFVTVPGKGNKQKLTKYISELQNGTCLLCNNNKIEHYHHIFSRKVKGADYARNIVGLCASCHDKVHKDSTLIDKLSSLKKGTRKINQVSLLNSIMSKLLNQMSDLCKQNNIKFNVCSGFQTAAIRKQYNLQKNHCIDGYCCSLFNREQLIPTNIPQFVYIQKRFKKKSKEIIKKNNSRIYKYDGKIVAKNRHKATEQKEDSLEEYMLKYAKNHTEKECRRHIHELEIIPAKRNYTYHKKFQEGIEKERPLIHVGDMVRYEKINKTTGKKLKSTFVAREIEFSEAHKRVRHSNNLEGRSSQGKLLKFCHSIESGATPCIGKKLIEI